MLQHLFEFEYLTLNLVDASHAKNNHETFEYIFIHFYTLASIIFDIRNIYSAAFCGQSLSVFPACPWQHQKNVSRHFGTSIAVKHTNHFSCNILIYEHTHAVFCERKKNNFQFADF